MRRLLIMLSLASSLVEELDLNSIHMLHRQATVREKRCA